MWLDQSLKHGWLSALPVADWLREHLIVQLRALRNTIFSVWLAYTVVWMAYGLRLISSTLLQVGPELEEAARSTGASRGQITRHVTVPLSRYGLIGSWLLMFLIFEREYSTGVYLLSPGTENHRLDAGVAVGGGGHRYRRGALLYQYSAGGDWPGYRPALWSEIT